MIVPFQIAGNQNGSRRMSRAFVKEQDADYFEELPERPVSEHANDVTEAGLAQIEHAIAAASEAYARAQAAAPSDHSEVRFGTSVTILRDDGRQQTFRIVGEDEADPAHGSISHVSPLARAMFGKRAGDVVPAGAGEAEIIRIQ
jgi:transcription elongation GreA/GreB family factor